VNELASDTALTPAARTKLGVCQYLLGRFKAASDTLAGADGGAMALFYSARCGLELGDYQGAIQKYEQAKTSGYDADQCLLGIAEAHRYAGNLQEAMSILDNMFGPIEQTADY